MERIGRVRRGLRRGQALHINERHGHREEPPVQRDATRVRRKEPVLGAQILQQYFRHLCGTCARRQATPRCSTDRSGPGSEREHTSSGI